MSGATAKALIAAILLPCWLSMMHRHQKPVAGALPSSILVPPISLWYDDGWWRLGGWFAVNRRCYV